MCRKKNIKKQNLILTTVGTTWLAWGTEVKFEGDENR
jgi:hypothetical protein